MTFSCLNAMLRKCFPPLTFQVPTEILTFDAVEYSPKFSMAFLSTPAGTDENGKSNLLCNIIIICTFKIIAFPF